MRLGGKEFGGVNKTFSRYIICSSIAVRWLTAVVRMGVEIEWTNEKSVAFFISPLNGRRRREGTSIEKERLGSYCPFTDLW